MKLKTNLLYTCAVLQLMSAVVWGAEQTKVFLSPVYTIDKIYRSMEGPTSTQKVSLSDSPTPELLWITGFRTEMMQEDGTTPSKPEFMCHVNLDFDSLKHRQAMGFQKMPDSRILTLSQGELSAKFPKGYGVPILSTESLSLTTQVLNLNNPELKTKVRHKVTFEFVRDRDLKTPMKPLFDVTPFVMAPLTDTQPMAGMDMTSMSTMNGESCLPTAAPAVQTPNQHAPNASSASMYKDAQGHPMSGHWVVPPGRSELKTDVTSAMNLPFDTTLHFAAVHLHPYAESLELRDITTHKTVFKSYAKNPKGRIGLDAVDNYSSEKGTPVFRDHHYQLISVYNNPTSVNSDSMAVMLLFLLDKEFKKPVLAAVRPGLSAEEKTTLSTQRIVMQTSLGNLVIALDPEIAPQTARQFSALARADAYAGVPLFFLQPGFLLQWGQVRDRTTALTPEQLALIKNLPLEAGGQHHRGVLSMSHHPEDPNSGESSFCIMFADEPHLDGQYTVFGHVEGSDAVLSAFEAAPVSADHKSLSRLEIQHMDVVADKSQVNAEPEAPSCHMNGPMTTGSMAAMAPAKVGKPKPFGPYIPSFGENLVVSDLQGKNGEKSKVVLFKNILMDKLYPSMLGPWTRAYLTLEDALKSPYVWITSYRAEVLEDGTQKASQEFMCHTKMDTTPVPGAQPSAGGSLSFFVISQGQDEVRFPKGFALHIPNPADRRVDLNVMVLNNNDPQIHKYLDFKATISYLDDATAKEQGITPLTLVTGSVYCPTKPEAILPEEELCEGATDEGSVSTTGHWLVPPGRHVYRAPAYLALTRDTTAHYIFMHVHPYAESFLLRDKTTGQTVWKGYVKNVAGQKLIRSTDHYSSVKGLPLFKGHNYQLEAVYNNITSEPIDAMASLWIYIRE